MAYPANSNRERRFKARQKITLLVHSMNAGGAQQRLATLANGFAEAGHDVEFVAVLDHGLGELRLSPQVKRSALISERPPRLVHRLLVGRRELVRHLQRSRPDILFAGITNVHLIAVLACRSLATAPKLVLRASRHPFRAAPTRMIRKRIKYLWRRQLDRWLYNQADQVIAVSGDVGEAVRTILKHPERCAVLPNPTITESFLQSLHKAPPHPWLRGDIPVVLGAGRLVYQKDFFGLITAMAEVIKKRPARLIIVGEGKMRTELEGLISNLGIADHVLLPGLVPDVGAWMRHADLFVSNSLYEGSPGVLIEALAAGTPIVATACPGGSVEVLGRGSGGMLVPCGNPSALASAIDKMLDADVDPRELVKRVEPYRVELSTRSHLRVLTDRAA